MKSLLIFAAVMVVWSQTPSTRLDLLGVFTQVVRLASPDGSHVLYGVPFEQGVSDEPELWIENTRTRQRQMLLMIPDTLSTGWSADGSAFYVQDHVASDETFSYIYDTDTLRRLDLAARIPVHFHGHTDEPPPISCFDFRYKVTRAGTVTKVSERVSGCN